MANPEISQKIVSPSADTLAQAARRAGAGGLPPVHLWNPPDCGDIDMRIARDGTWYYLGTPIGRPAMVRLFSTILRKDGDRFVLVTPVEKVGIVVEDAPFVAVDYTVTGTGDAQTLTFETNVGDMVVADADHGLRVARDPVSGEPAPYIHVRAGLEALIDRKSFLRLAEIGVHFTQDGTSWFGVWSGGSFFPMIASVDLDDDPPRP